MMRRLPAALAGVALLGIATSALSYSTYAKWANMPVTIYINPKNADVSTAAATAAIQ